MPELPEVETVVRAIRPRTVGRVIRGVPHASPLMARTDTGRFAERLRGRRIERLDRHGKWMFFHLSDEAVFVAHLGMTGRLGIAERDAESAPHTHLRLRLGDGAEELRFSDARRFGELWVYRPDAWYRRFGPHRLGPDALRITTGDLAKRLRLARRRLKAVLLDQRAVAGIGNIYADEVLFESSLNPARSANRLRPEESARLHHAVGSVLRRAIRCNGTSIRDYVTAEGVPGEFQERLNVYGRADLPCKKCSTRIELTRTVVTGRATYWCPVCQVGPTRRMRKPGKQSRTIGTAS